MGDHRLGAAKVTRGTVDIHWVFRCKQPERPDPSKVKNEYVEMGYHREAECGMNLYLNV